MEKTRRTYISWQHDIRLLARDVRELLTDFKFFMDFMDFAKGTWVAKERTHFFDWIRRCQAGCAIIGLRRICETEKPKTTEAKKQRKKKTSLHLFLGSIQDNYALFAKLTNGTISDAEVRNDYRDLPGRAKTIYEYASTVLAHRLRNPRPLARILVPDFHGVLQYIWSITHKYYEALTDTSFVTETHTIPPWKHLFQKPWPAGS